MNYLSRYAINPARDLGPRLFLLIAGWGTQAFTSHYHWSRSCNLFDDTFYKIIEGHVDNCDDYNIDGNTRLWIPFICLYIDNCDDDYA